MKTTILNTLGWIGVVCILSAYAMNVFGILTSGSFIYLFLNFLGSGFIVLEAFNKKDYQPAVLNLIWALVAIIMLLKIFYG